LSFGAALSFWRMCPRRSKLANSSFLNCNVRLNRQLDEHLRAALGAAGLGAGSGRRGDTAVPFSSPLHWAPFKVFGQRTGFCFHGGLVE